LDEVDRAVAGLARVARAAADSSLARRWRRPDGDARPGPGEAAVGRPADPYAARVVRAVEVDVGVVGDALPVVDDRRITAAVQVVTARKRRERDDPVVPVVAVVCRGVEARRTPSNAIVVRTAEVIRLVLRCDVDRRLVLRQAGVILVRPDVATGVAHLLDVVLGEASQRRRGAFGLEAGLRTLRDRVAEAVEVLVLERTRQRRRV